MPVLSARRVLLLELLRLQPAHRRLSTRDRVRIARMLTSRRRSG
jgi:hypothetical protein